jgi:hypothetical protein
MAETPLHKWPTPDDTDRVSAGAAAMRALGDAIDNDVPKIWVGSVTVPVANNPLGTTQTVTFPAGFFTANPRVHVQAIGTTAYVAVVPSTPGMATMAVSVRHIDNTAATTNIPVHIVAMQESGATRAVALPAPPADDTEGEAIA